METNNQNNNNQYNQDSYSQNPYSQGNCDQNPYSQGSSDQNPYAQNTYYQQSYGQQQPAKDETVSVLDWIGTYLITAIPCVGLIMYIVWAFSSTTKKSKSNYCKACLILMLIGIAIYVVIFAILMATAGVSYMEKASMM